MSVAFQIFCVESIHARSKFKAILQSKALADLVRRFESWTGAWARDAGDPAALVGLGNTYQRLLRAKLTAVACGTSCRRGTTVFSSLGSSAGFRGRLKSFWGIPEGGFRRSRPGASRRAIAVSTNSLPPFASVLAVLEQRQSRDSDQAIPTSFWGDAGAVRMLLVRNPLKTNSKILWESIQMEMLCTLVSKCIREAFTR